jgi:CarD family transcriptional regulator
MTPSIGETLVYPHHGAVTITNLEQMTVKGVERQFMTLRVHASDLMIKLPVDNVELVGVRDVIDAVGVRQVFDVLRAPFVEEPTNWSRRYKANQEKMASGSVYRVSEVVRDLWRRDQENGVSAGEKRMMQKAWQILASEIALARHESYEEASEIISTVLATPADAEVPV